MPYKTVWEDAEKNPDLPVHENLPDGLSERSSLFDNLKEAHGIINGEYESFHFCRHCNGWIEGNANRYQVNSLNSRRLSGRRGTDFHCRRCGERIAFNGIVS